MDSHVQHTLLDVVDYFHQFNLLGSGLVRQGLTG